MKQEQDLSRWAEGSAYNAIQDIAIGFQKSQILFAGVKHDIFSQIKAGNNTVEKIAAHSNINSNALERLLNALVAIKLLIKQGMYYENSPISEKHLVKSSEDYYGFMLHYADLWGSWGTLAEVVKTGKIVANTPIHEKDDEFIKDFLLAWDWRAKFEVDVLLGEIPLKNIKRFLKVGAVSYRYAFEIARKHPEIEITIVDYPKVITVAEKIAAKEWNCSNVKFVSLDYANNELGKNYDIVFIDSIIEDYSVIENIAMFKRVYDAVSNGGKLVVYQLLMNDARTEPLVAALQSVNLLLNTYAGNTYTYSDLWVVLKEAGFNKVDFYTVMTSAHIVIASKSLIG